MAPVKVSADLDAKWVKTEAICQEYLNKMRAHTSHAKHTLSLDKMLGENKVLINEKDRDLLLREVALTKAHSQDLNPRDNKDDVDINIGDTSTPTHNQISGPITRTRACQLNNQVSSFLASYSSYLDNGNVCSILLLRNDGQEGNRVGFARATFGLQNSSTL
jgi:hypothetical protein